MFKNLDKSLILKIIKLSLPIVLANALQSAYQLTDTFWVGRIGANAVAALSVCYPVIFLLITIGIGFSIAGSVLVSQYKGINDQTNIDYIASQSLFVMITFGILVAVLGYFTSDYIILFLGLKGEVYEGATTYLKYAMFGLVFQYVFLCFQNILRAVGNVKTPLFVVFITVILNFIIDPIFIMGYGPISPMGIKGAAYATIITQGLAAIIGLYFISNGKHSVTIKLKCMFPNWALVKRILSLGAPTSLEGSTRALSMNLMTLLVAGFGNHVIAVFGIGIRILSFIIIPALGFSQATSVIVGNTVGAKDYKQTYKTARYSIIIMFMALSLAGLIVFIFAENAIAVFLPNEPTVISEGATFIRILAFTFGFVGVQQVCNGIFRGAGNTMLAMMIAIIGMWVLRFPIAYILSAHTDMAENGIWWSFAISNVITAFIGMGIYLRKRWIKNLVEYPNQRKVEKVVDDTIENNV